MYVSEFYNYFSKGKNDCIGPCWLMLLRSLNIRGVMVNGDYDTNNTSNLLLMGG